jgi:hypothetical protein
MRAACLAVACLALSQRGVQAQEFADGYPEPLTYHNAVYGTPPTMTPSSASLYPSPVPHVPVEVGGSMITNQGLNPHEMLYPHRYRALYGPFYYVKTVGFPTVYRRPAGYWCTPWGTERPRYRWGIAAPRKLCGTCVDIKYRGHINPFSRFMPPWF